MTKDNSCNRIRLISKVIAIATLLSMGLCYNLWLSERTFPSTPIFDFLPTLFHPYDYIIPFIAAFFLILIILSRNPQPYIIGFTISAIFLALFDLNRWQPWFYQYTSMFFILSFFNYRCDDIKQQNAILSIFKLMLAAVYFWSGLQKLNPNFLADTFPWLMEPITNHLGKDSLNHFRMLGIAFPLIESISGIMLLINPIKKLGLIMIISMHVFILFVIGPFGHNYNPVVWPWNIAMILFSLLLFNNEEAFDISDIRNMFRYHSIKIIFILFILLPQLNFFNRWDSYLSHNLYSGNTDNGEIYMSESIKNSLPEEIKQYAVQSDNDYCISIKYWCMKELNVPAYPEKRNFEYITNYIHNFTKDTTSFYLDYKAKSKINE